MDLITIASAVTKMREHASLFQIDDNALNSAFGSSNRSRHIPHAHEGITCQTDKDMRVIG